ncbi:hypothetical protein ABL78_0124 [Leptomonas seymouri]|uniref:Integral membrane protein n=1 Tax=Leptomonas seymouri TaxID=5684 RepID=A0A0N1IAN0_LEPSE|nr:hypothetical protein ABL78_0124 [Leptomonas seymouri]|eukprot:KPI90688.1 hypothetical protein ABL78_0124 [Leptomonas seymouri]
MAIGLGRTIGSPIFLFFQILHGVSLFFVMLGVSRVALGVLELAISAAAPSTAMLPSRSPTFALKPKLLAIADPLATTVHEPRGELLRGFHEVVGQHRPYADHMVDQAAAAAGEPMLSLSAQLSYCFHVPLTSLFHSPAAVYLKAADKAAPLKYASKVPPLRYDGSTGRFYLQHLFAAALCAYPLALLLQRRKFVLDFVATIYVAYWVLTDLMLRSVLGGGAWHWWGACLSGMVTMYATTYGICRWKEMQEIKLSSGGAGAGVNTASVLTSKATTAWVMDSRGDNGSDAREMEEVLPMLQDVFSPTSPAAVMPSSGDMTGLLPDKAVGRSRPTTGEASPKAVVVEVDDAEEVPFKNKSV